MCQVGNYPFEDPADPGSFSKTIQVGWVLAPAHDFFHLEFRFSKAIQVGRQSWLQTRVLAADSNASCSTIAWRVSKHNPSGWSWVAEP